MKTLKTLRRLLFFGYQSSIPQRQLVVGYLIHIIIGTILLLLPWANAGTPVHLVDQLFTAVSALSTTGLCTVDVASHYTLFGQAVILCLMQMGGLGFMTLSSFLKLGITHHMGRNAHNIFLAQFALPGGIGIRTMLRAIILFTLFFETLGTLLLYLCFSAHGIDHPLWTAVFHAVSAFCTAGFSTFSGNMTAFRTDYAVNLIIILLSYMGAMGFIMMTDIARWLRYRKHSISFTTRIIFIITCGLSLFATLHLFFLEPSLRSLPFGERLLAAFFQAVSAMTTTGFNTIDISPFMPLSLFVLTITMYIGASPSGTGGGLKSTTLSAIFAYTKSKLQMREDITLAGNIIPRYRIETAVTTVIFYTFLLFTGTYIIMLAEPSGTSLINVLFESVSALATTGLTSGLLASLTPWSKCVLIVLMFAGRVGVITFAGAFLMGTMQKKALHGQDLAV